MKRTSVLASILFGALTALPVMALSYLGQTAGLPFAPFDFFDWLARTLPGDIITAGIDAMVDTIRAINIGPTSEVAKPVEQLTALMTFTAIGAGFGLVLGLINRRSPMRLTATGIRGGLLLFAGLWLISASLGVADAPLLLSGLWLAVLMGGWGWGLAWVIKRAGPAFAAAPPSEPASAPMETDTEAAPMQSSPAMGRREFVRITGGSIAALTVGSYGLARLLEAGGSSTPVVVEPIEVTGMVDSPPDAELAARIAPAPGTRSEKTSNADFYRIDINTRKPSVDSATWRLQLDGLVKSPLNLSLDELMAMPSISYYHTLSCISNRIGGDLIGTTLWTGVPISYVLGMAELRDTAQELFIESFDGFYESVPMRDLMNDRTILAYAMDGMPLPQEHGYPLRIIIPGHYGMKQPKWIEHMEVLDHEGRGYWVERGWSAEAFVRTTSVIDSVSGDAYDEASGTIPIGGIGWAGTNGISKVEVQVDDGPWAAAQLRAPALSPNTWVQWRYDWPRVSGRHDFRVRAYDLSGTLQITSPEGVRPDGATGIHELTKSV